MVLLRHGVSKIDSNRQLSAHEIGHWVSDYHAWEFSVYRYQAS